MCKLHFPFYISELLSKLFNSWRSSVRFPLINGSEDFLKSGANTPISDTYISKNLIHQNVHVLQRR